MMNKNAMKALAVGLLLMTSGSVNAQIDLKSIAGKVLGTDTETTTTESTSSSSTSKSGSLIQSLTSIFSSKKQASADNIVGTWTYQEPAVVLTSSNAISNAAYKVASNKVESKLQSYLNTVGIKPGTFSITFNADGTCTETLKGKSTKGKWSIENQKLKLTVVGSKAVNITTQLSGSELMLVTDATKLLEMFKSFGANSSNSTLKTAAAALGGAKGMQAGVTLKKQ